MRAAKAYQVNRKEQSAYIFKIITFKDSIPVFKNRDKTKDELKGRML